MPATQHTTIFFLANLHDSEEEKHESYTKPRVNNTKNSSQNGQMIVEPISQVNYNIKTAKDHVSFFMFQNELPLDGCLKDEVGKLPFTLTMGGGG